ncbi:MAG: TIGR00730 family Rossman fold protein [Anaerolineae bacterium]|nr:TIGR00730 family Rossman fold protein [Anaerolineae bacterium]
MKRICVFCGSSPGVRPEYVEAARQLGRTLASKGIGLVYGGAKVGTMGQLASAALAAGGEVTGVIPEQLAAKEVAFTELADLQVVGSMHARKARMVELSDGFIALPGGLGTFEEFFEALTWAQLGLHHKPCGLLNVCGYYDKLMAFLDHAVAQQFVKAEYRAMALVDEDPERLLEKFAAYRPPEIDKAAWILQLNEQSL